MLINLLIVPFFFSADFSIVFVHTYIISMITLYVFSFLHENKKLQTWNVSPLLACWVFSITWNVCRKQTCGFEGKTFWWVTYHRVKTEANVEVS